MFSLINKLFIKTKFNRIAVLLTGLLSVNVKFVLAEGPPAKSSMTNPLVIVMVSFMIVLLIIIAVLSNMLLGIAESKFKKWKEEQRKNTTTQTAAVIAGLLLLCNPIFAQTTASTSGVAAATATTNIAEGVSAGTFYLMAIIIFFELIVILALLINLRGLLMAEKEKAAVAETAVTKKKVLNWWNKFNKFRPAEQEADIDLGHDYDGIRELDNRLPPWWLWGFYITIAFGIVYLYRYHVAHSAPLSAEEYTISVARADQEVKEYLKQKGDAVDENTVTMLGKDDIDAAKTLFETSCVTCHSQGGAGNVGPNLTDDYWIHGGDIKSVFKTIKYGFNAMPSWQNTYSNKQIAQLASYVKSLYGTNPANPKAPQGELFKETATAKTDSTATKTDSSAAKTDSSAVSK
jgi:cytochrome c oxidase cbb3-type subunit 3